MKTILNEELRMKNEELGRVRARDSHRCSRPFRWLALRLRTFRNSFVGDRRIRQRLRVFTFLILNSSFLIPSSAFADASDYRAMLATLELARSAKAAKTLAAQGERLESAEAAKQLVELYNSAESFADLRLWYLRNTQPKIFVEIETASNATDMGYFRLDFNATGKLGKYRMLREEFGVK